MKTLHINASYKPAYIYGGPTMSVAMLCEQLVIAGIDTNVFTTTANGISELSVNTGHPVKVEGVNVTYFKRITKDHTHLSPSLLKNLWNQVTDFDLVHIHAWWNLVSVLTCFIAISRKVPVVISPRGTLSSYSFAINNSSIKSIIHHFLGRRLLQKSNLHVTSLQEQSRVLEIIQPKSIQIIPNLVKLPAPHEQDAKIASTVLKLVFLSRIEAKKGLDLLFSALKEVTVPYRLTIAGDGEKEYINHLKNLAELNEVANNIDWIGFQGDCKFELLRNHDLFVLPSFDENFGNSVIESLAEGTAVLISENVGLAGYTDQNKLGWICPLNCKSIAETINNIGGNERGQLADIRVKAPQIIYNDFAPENLTLQYIKMYKDILKHD